MHEDNKQLVYRRGPLVFVFNFHPTESYTDLRIPVPDPKDYKLILNTDDKLFEGFGRVAADMTYLKQSQPIRGTAAEHPDLPAEPDGAGAGAGVELVLVLTRAKLPACSMRGVAAYDSRRPCGDGSWRDGSGTGEVTGVAQSLDITPWRNEPTGWHIRQKMCPNVPSSSARQQVSGQRGLPRAAIVQSAGAERTHCAGDAMSRIDVNRCIALPLLRIAGLRAVLRCAATSPSRATCSRDARRSDQPPPRRPALACCPACGFISNTAFDAATQELTAKYEASQGFSATFNAFAKRLAERWAKDYLRPGKTALEIGCLLGEFTR